MYCEQDDWDPTPDLLVPPFFHSYHDLLHYSRLKRLEGAVTKVFAEVREDLRELRVKKGGGGGRSGSSGGGVSAATSTSSFVEEREGKRAKVDVGGSAGAAGEGKEWLNG